MKKIFTFFLSLLWLTSFEQGTPINIRTGDPRTLLSGSNGYVFNSTTGLGQTDSSKVILNITIAQLRASTTLNSVRRYYITDAGREGVIYRLGSAPDDNGINFHDGNGNNWHRSYDGKHPNVTWFGNIGDGITDNTSTWTNMTPYLPGQDPIVPNGQYIVNNATWTNPESEDVMCAGRDSVNFICTTTDQCFGFAGAMHHWKMHGFSINCTWTNLTQDFGHALMSSYGLINDDVEIYDFYGSCANTNSDVIAFVCQTGTYGGSIRHLYIHNFDLKNVGQTGITVLSRDSSGQAALMAGTTTLANSGYDSCFDVRIEKFTATNMGICSGATYGMVVTLDGYGYNIYIGNGTATNGLNQGFENTGMWNVTFDNLNGQGPGVGRSWELFAIGNTLTNAPVWHMTLMNCHEIDTMSTGDGATYANDLQISGCTFKAKNPFKFKNCNNINAILSNFIAFDVAGLDIISTPGYTSTGNVFNQCFITNATFAGQTGCVQFDGKGVNNNKILNCKIIKGSGGVNVLWKDTAGYQNYVQNFDLGSGASNGFYTSALPATATQDTMYNDADLDYKFYQFTGTVSQTDTVVFASRMHTNFAIQDSSNHSIFVKMLGGGEGVLIPSGAVMAIYSDSLNLRTINTLPTGATLVSSPSSGNNSTQIASTNMVQLAIAGTIASGKIKPTVASVSGPITSITADSLVYGKAGNGLSCSGSFTCTPPASGSCTASVTLPNPSGLLGGHACFGVASWSNGTTNGVSTSIIGAGSGGATVAQITWVSGGATTTTIYYILVYYQQ
jgi:hypothetical protein